jgi:glycosyltransferase involved in cell wall biosynthesis
MLTASRTIAAPIAQGKPAGRLRIAVVSDAALGRNGVGTYYADLLQSLSPHLESARLFAPDDAVAGWRRWLMPPLPGDYTQRLWWPPVFSLWRELRRLSPDVIIVPTPGPWGLLGMYVARRLNVPLIVGFHTHFVQLTRLYWSSFFGRLCRWWLESANRWLFASSELILVNSPEMRQAARDVAPARIEMMGTALPLAVLRRPLAAAPTRIRNLLFAGRLAAEKNLEAVISLAESLPEIRVTIAGDGPCREQVIEAAEKTSNLDYVGWLSRGDLIDCVDRSDMLLLPSHVESFGTVALEAMARGRMVLVTESCGIAQWPQYRDVVFVKTQGETVAEAVRRAARLDPSELLQRSRAGIEVARHWNERHVSQWMKHLHQLVNSDDAGR